MTSASLPVRAPLAVPDAVRPARPLQIEVACSADALAALEPAWNRLVEAAGCELPFVRHEWVSTWWRAFSEGRRLHVVVVKEGDEPIAIVPLMWGPVRLYGLRLRAVEFVGNVHTPRFDCVVSRRADDVYAAVWAHLRDVCAWDVVRLRDLEVGSEAARALRAHAASDGFLTGLWRSSEAPFVTLCGSWDAYLASLRAKHRSNLRNRFKRLARLGEVWRETLVSASPEALSDAFRIEASGWKGAAATAIATGAETERFYRTLGEAAAGRGWLRLHFLRLSGQRIAFQYALEGQRRIWVLKLGYDPAFAAFSPQNLLCARVLEDAHARGVRRYEFLGEREDWKLEWAREAVAHEWLFILRNDRPGRLLHALKFRLLPRLRNESVYRLLRDGACRRWAEERG